MKGSVLVAFFVWMLISSASVSAEEQQQQAFSVPAGIQSLLKQEMIAVEQGMKQLVSSIAKGEWDEVVKIGRQIQASYIMKQSLTTEQKQHLHHVLPEQFISFDQSFHQYAGMLAHAAKAKNADVVNFYFYKMNDSCIQCHSRYAQKRFPAFTSSPESHSAQQH